jgi:hypothetical protein
LREKQEEMTVRTQAFAASALLFTLLGGTAAHSATTGTFQPVGNTTTPRLVSTATLLKDGTVLVTGGWKRTGADYSENGLISQETAELFDPKTNSFSAVGSMAFPRTKHTAVRLQDGRVLVVGGSNDYFPDGGIGYPSNKTLIAAAELYDPATGKFSTTGSLVTPRLHPTATLLPNGKVLVVGGWNTDTVETAELYDPATGNFTVTRPMVSGRNRAAAVALPDGRVALLGGYHFEDGPQRSVEVYDYRTDTYSQLYDFSPAGQLAEARADFSAVLLSDGRIMAIGGTSGPSDTYGQGTTILSSVEIYDPATGQSTVTDRMADPRYFGSYYSGGAVALADGRVLVAGGQHLFDGTDPTVHLTSAVLIDPVTGKVSPTGSMINAFGAAPTLLQDGRVLVLGGRPRKLFAEVYVP